MKVDRILISRIDAIGDVTLTLPMCGYLKASFPNLEIFFLGRSYTRAVIYSSSAIDHFIDYNDLVALPKREQLVFVQGLSLDACIHVFPSKHLSFLFKDAKVPLRIGTTNRWYHWFTCNKLVKLSRRNSDLHEAELNLRLLGPIGITKFPTLQTLNSYYQLDKIITLPTRVAKLISAEKFNIVFHPKSHGSGKEWPLSAYKEVIEMLPRDQYRVFISGSEKEKLLLSDWIKTLEGDVLDMTGEMNLPEFIAFLHKADGLVACSTGPLHLAAASGTHALGLYPNTPPLHPGRWGPVGKRAEFIESEGPQLETILPVMVYQRIRQWSKKMNQI